MTVEAGFGVAGVSVNQNALRIGGSTYPLNSIAGLRRWEDKGARKALKVLFFITLVGAVLSPLLYYYIENNRYSAGFLPAFLLLWPMVLVTGLAGSGLLVMAVVVVLRSMLGFGRDKHHLIISFTNGRRHSVRGHASQIDALEAALEGIMAGKFG